MASLALSVACTACATQPATVTPAARAASQAPSSNSPISVSNPKGSLIFDSAGQKTINFTIAGGASGSNLVVVLYGYDGNGVPSTTPIATYRAPASANVSVPVTLPGPGLYQVAASLGTASSAGANPKLVNLAVIGNVPPNAMPGAGVVTHFGQVNGKTSPASGLPANLVLPLVKKAGFSWIRDELYWSSIEKQAGQFVYPKQYDDYMSAVAAANISPLIVLDYGNGAAYPTMFKGTRGFPQNDQERALFANYTKNVVSRYGKTVKAWEVWNEPNFKSITYDNYVGLLKVVYPTVKAISPNASVVACGGGGAGGGPGGDCISEVIKNGGGAYQDGFSIHPYMSPYNPDTGYPAKGSPLPNVSVSTVWPHLNSMMKTDPSTRSARPRPFKLWVTEIGWPSSPQSAGLSEPAQAANFARTFLLSRRFNAVQALFWYDFINDGENDPNNKEANFGLLHLDLTAKPAYVAAATLARTLGSRAWTRALVETNDTKVYQYGSGDTIYVGWQTGTGSTATPVNIPPGNYVQRDWQGTTTNVVVPAQGFSWQLGALPKYLIPASQAH